MSYDYRQAQEEVLAEQTSFDMALCPRTFGKGCKLCEAVGIPGNTRYRNITISWNTYPGILYSRVGREKYKYPPSMRETASIFKVREDIWTYVMFMRQDPDQIFMFRVGWSVFKFLKSLAHSEAYKRFWDLHHGYEIQIEKTKDVKTGRNSYSVIPLPKPVPIPKPEVFERVPDLTIDLIVDSVRDPEKRVVPVRTIGQLDTGITYVRFLPVLHEDQDIWLLRVFWHRGITQDLLDRINAGQEDPYVVMFHAPLEVIEQRLGYYEEIEEKEEELPEDEIFEDDNEMDEDEEGDVDIDEEGGEEEEVDDFIPGCFGDPKLYSPDMDTCRLECDYFEECGKEVRRRMKQTPKKK